MTTFWPFRHLGLKLLSLGLALLLWMSVAGEEIVERGLRVPLELQQFPPGLELQGEPPVNVDVRVRGASEALSRVGAGDVFAVLDLHGATPGRRLFHLTPEQVRVPFGVDVVQVSPATVALAFERSATKQVKVTPSIEGLPAPGYVLGAVTADPGVADVVGPESAVKRVEDALTEPVNVTGARDTVHETVTLGLFDPSLRLKGSRTTTVTVQVLPGPVEHTFRSVPIHLRNLPPSLSAEANPSTVNVTIRGSRDAVNRVDPDELNVFVDLQGLGSGTYTVTPHGVASSQAGVIRIDPSTVQVHITRGSK